jgi:hypothetical protein
MKKILLIGAILLTASLTVPFIVLAPYLDADHDFDIPVDVPQENIFDVTGHLKKIDTLDIGQTFPHQVILDSCNINDVGFILNVLNTLDTMYPNQRMNNMIAFSETLTKLKSKQLPLNIKVEELDTLYHLLKWNNNFKVLSIADAEHAMFFKVLNNYWSTYITGQLSDLATQHKNIKYNTKFQFLYAYYKSEQYTAIVPTSSLEKVIYNIQNSRSGYLLFKFKAMFGVLGIVLIGAFVLLTITAYAILFKSIYKLIKK